MENTLEIIEVSNELDVIETVIAITEIAQQGPPGGGGGGGSETVTTMGALISGATAKTTPADADNFLLTDSAASHIGKKITWANIKAALKTYFDTLYVALTGNQTIAGVKTFSSSPIVPAPTTDLQASTKKYVDDAISGIPAGPQVLDDLDDVDASSVSIGHFLRYDGGWLAAFIQPSDMSEIELSYLKHVDVSTADNGDFIRFDGTDWVDSPILEADIPTGIDPGKIGDGTVDVTEFGYLSGVDSGPIQSQINERVIRNVIITGATKTKITYDSKGLVTSGADATTSDIAEGSNLYHTAARVRAVVLTGLSLATSQVIAATDTVLQALGYLQAQITALTTTVSAKAADSAVVHNTGAETVAGVKTFSSDPIIPDEAYDATNWNGSLEPATKNAVRDEIEAVKATIGGGGYSDEQAQDAAAALFTPDDGDIDYTYNDGTPSVTSTIKAAAVSLAKMAAVATGTIFYRKTAGTGDPEVQTLATLKTDLGLTGTNSGDETASTLGATINGAAAATPNNTDLVATVESSVVKKITWTNVKAFLKTYFDTLYPSGSGTSTGTNTGDQTSVTGNAGTATALQNARTIDGQSFDGTANITVIAPGTNAATGKTTPLDADMFPIVDTAASNALKKVTFTNFKAFLKTYFDTLYQALNSNLTTLAGLTATTDNFIVSVSSAWASRTPAQVKTTLSLNNVDNTSNATERAATATLENKRIKPRTGTAASSATPTINTDNVDFYSLTAQAVDITSFTTNLSGTPVENQKLWIAITGTAARAITWGSSFEASTVALPTTTVSTNRLDVGFVWNTVTSKWRCIAVA